MQGDKVPEPLEHFGQIDIPAKDRNLRELLLRNIDNSAYKEPTPVQMQSVPAIMAGRDVLVCAPTGSGKTAAFVLPIIARLRAPRKSTVTAPRAIILAPTRELAGQIAREFEKLSSGKKFACLVLSKANAASVKTGRSLDVLVTTPMRMVNIIQTKTMSFAKCEVLVLDEADKLLELGFVEQVDEIMAATCHADTARALFSATVPQVVDELADVILRNPVSITIGKRNAGAETIEQSLQFVGREDGKLLALRQHIQSGIKPPVIVFVQSKERAAELFRELVYDGINVDVIHAERTQQQRDAIVTKFRTGEIWVLIATDLMARGMDFKGVNCVINYDFPQSMVSYVHRIGRTGRAGRVGKAITFFTEADMEMLRTIANVMRISGCDVPAWMLSMKSLSRSRKKELANIPRKRQSISTASTYSKQKAAKRRNIVKQSKR